MACVPYPSRYKSNISLTNELRQTQTMAPALVHSLKLLEKPVLELSTLVKEEIAANPIIEQDELSPVSIDAEREAFDNPEYFDQQNDTDVDSPTYDFDSSYEATQNDYNEEVITSAITKYVSDMYAEQATGLEPITLTEEDKELTTIFDRTERLTKGIDSFILAKVDELRKKGANYDYTFRKFKTFERFMLENEILSRIPDSICNQRQPIVNISLSPQEIEELTQRYNVGEDELLGLIDTFSNINIQSASISLPNGRKATIDRNGNISNGQPKFKKESNIIK